MVSFTEERSSASGISLEKRGRLSVEMEARMCAGTLLASQSRGGRWRKREPW